MLRLDFCRLVDLDVETKRIIRRRMSWRVGVMREWLCDQRKDIHLCLLYNGQLATWISLTKLRGDGACDVGAWTSPRYRGRGFAQTALWALIDHHRKALGITRKTKFMVHHPSMGGIVKRLGYKVY